ncbi:MAG: Cysteine-rich secretory protein family protein [bacterium ADurb.Bin212]|nr:MAG: Cysteine-rich secretory protein family protein [bacterium ADurb.Bin212]
MKTERKQKNSIPIDYKQNPKVEIKAVVKHKHIVRKVCELVLLALLVGAGSASAYASEITKENVYKQINYYREIRGLKPLEEDQRLESAAEKKAQDMLNRDYFEHYAYNLTPWNFIAEQDYNYLYAGENLAMDFQTSEGMVRAWMSSPTHRKNILNPDFDDIGIGIVKGEYTENDKSHETIMVTNMFGKEKPKLLQFFDSVMNSLKKIF